MIIVTPLPMGSVEPGAVSIVQTIIFLLLIGNIGLVLYQRKAIVIDQVFGRLATPAIMFLGLLAFQLIPLPPTMIRAISPATYHLYSLSLPDWPPRTGHPIAHRDKQAVNSGTTAEARDIAGNAKTAKDTHHLGSEFGERWCWRELSIAPSMSRQALLKVIAYVAWFFLLLYEADRRGDKRAERTFQRIATIAIVSSGLIVAILGIIELFTWNGKILWFFVPFDWRGSAPAVMLRASGPFVNPDHFGNYLAMVLPIAAAGTFFDLKLWSQRALSGFRLFCATSAFVIVAALLLSASLGAWISAGCGLTALILLSSFVAYDARPRFLRPDRTVAWCGAIILSAMVVLALVFVGPRGRQQIDQRLQNTASNNESLATRARLAADTLQMVRDYPMFGVGLGAWPELFPRYRRPPWSPAIFRETHDDYVQALAETGIAGFLLVLWFFAVVIEQLRQAFVANHGPVPPTLAALCSSLVVIAVHEAIDFNLQITSNALLAAFILALALRMARDRRTPPYFQTNAWMHASYIVPIAAVLIVCALLQNKIPYPYNVPVPSTPAEAITLINSHPAESSPHVELSLLLNRGSFSTISSRQLHTAASLDPTNPYVRDLYSLSLLHNGELEKGLSELQRSVEYSPSLATHIYLSERYIHQLNSGEAAAIEQGFKRAIARGDNEATQELAGFYFARARFDDAAAAYLAAARQMRDKRLSVACVLNAATAYVQAGRYADASAVFRQAIANDPAYSDSYRRFVTLVLGPQHQLKAASILVAHGIEAGADSSSLYTALADAAYKQSDLALTEAALRAAIADAPSFSTYLRLGQVYLEDKQYDHAALYLRRAVQLDPSSADGYFSLGLAEEADYHFTQAEQDLLRAVQLAPDNATYHEHYQQFEHRMAAGAKELPLVP